MKRKDLKMMKNIQKKCGGEKRTKNEQKCG